MTVLVVPDLRIRNRTDRGLFSLVGNTPLMHLQRFGNTLPGAVSLYAKAEWYNPSGSVKDRPAANIIRNALADGSLSKGKRLLDSTSGNMGISYACFGASLGISVTLVLPANASPERIKMLKVLGAELILTDPTEGSDGAQREARRLAEEHPERYFYANQYDNPANWQAHYHSTGPEIVSQTDGEITHFIAGLGTTGTLTGTGRYLHEYCSTISVVGVQPDQPFHGLEGLKHLETAIPPGIFDPTIVDRIIGVATEVAYQTVRQLAREEGLFVGVSSGAAAWAGLQVAKKLTQGVVVIMFPDAGYKYLSERFWVEGS